MRKLILGVAVSLDGFIEGPNGEYDWCFSDQDYGMRDFIKRIDAIFMGRKTYEMMQSFEGQAGGNPWQGIKTYVFSNTLKSNLKDAEIVSGDIATQVRTIKTMNGKDIWLFGGASLTTTLMNEKLVDELWLSVHPILLGRGKPLFENLSSRIITKLIHSKTYDTGLVSLAYEVHK
jgi:dihydrofolate reductase